MVRRAVAFLLTLGAFYALPATAAEVWGIQPATGTIVRLNPATGAVLGSFPVPDVLPAGNVIAGLTIAEGGTTLLYQNNAGVPSNLYRLDPLTGAVLTVQTMIPSINRGGLGFESGAPDSIFAVNDGAPVDRQSGFNGPVAPFYNPGGPVAFPGASGGDDAGRQFVFVLGVMIQEFSPTVPNTQLNSFPSPSGTLGGMAYDGQFLYVSDFNVPNLWTLDPNTGAVQNMVVVPGGPLIGLGARAAMQVPALAPAGLMALIVAFGAALPWVVRRRRGLA